MIWISRSQKDVKRHSARGTVTPRQPPTRLVQPARSAKSVAMLLSPSCSYCATHAKDCVYPPPFVRAQCSQSYVPPLRLPTVAVLYGLKANKQVDMSMPLKLD